MTERHSDGRIARGERTRDAIVEAHAGLLREGVLKPTAKVIAERAGVSLRTLWLNFKDLETLLEATTAYWLDADAALRRPIDPDLPLADRIDRYCTQRVSRLEHIAPAARSSALGEPFSAALQRSRHEHVERALQDLDATFGRELDEAGTDRTVLADALFAASSWPAWSSLRDDLGLDADAATAILRTTLTRLLRA
ncbi:TetR family transcriptional regulator [Aeromicrobium sp. Root344]|uniref:TetR/AcrR family transcriptional regulator n=1 Tax=Aeromicrobium sp. Root344 TaxID=1736521 RepID=UPI0006F6C95B|nr:TetR/AcrR family transcriptional regulator [Aeromicrobium sp. Root344]KQV74785.1 TetR family transcriptional regulator [Aeromicrobium sp. Root344]